MTRKEFEDYMIELSEDQYDSLIQERIARLNPTQKAVALKREEERKMRAKLRTKAAECETEDERQHIYDVMLDIDAQECAHGRHWCKPCSACIEIDHLMFPEFHDEDGDDIE